MDTTLEQMRSRITVTSEVYTIRLNPVELGDLWRYLKPLIIAGLPPGTEPTEQLAAALQKALHSGLMWCWVMMRGEAPIGVVTACVTQDICAKTRNLTVYSAWFSGTPPTEGLKKLYGSLLRQAKMQGCSRLAGYLVNEKAFKVLSKLKGARSMIYMEVDIG